MRVGWLSVLHGDQEIGGGVIIGLVQGEVALSRYAFEGRVEVSKKEEPTVDVIGWDRYLLWLCPMERDSAGLEYAPVPSMRSHGAVTGA